MLWIRRSLNFVTRMHHPCRRTNYPIQASGLQTEKPAVGSVLTERGFVGSHTHHSPDFDLPRRVVLISIIQSKEFQIVNTEYINSCTYKYNGDQPRVFIVFGIDYVSLTYDHTLNGTYWLMAGSLTSIETTIVSTGSAYHLSHECLRNLDVKWMSLAPVDDSLIFVIHDL